MSAAPRAYTRHPSVRTIELPMPGESVTLNVTPPFRTVRLRDVTRHARFLPIEDPGHAASATLLEVLECVWNDLQRIATADGDMWAMTLAQATQIQCVAEFLYQARTCDPLGVAMAANVPDVWVDALRTAKPEAQPGEAFACVAAHLRSAVRSARTVGDMAQVLHAFRRLLVQMADRVDQCNQALLAREGQSHGAHLCFVALRHTSLRTRRETQTRHPLLVAIPAAIEGQLSLVFPASFRRE